MPSRAKNRHKPRHHAHKVKPSSISKPGLPPLVPPTPAQAQPEVQAPVAVEHVVEQNKVATDPVQSEVHTPPVVENPVEQDTIAAEVHSPTAETTSEQDTIAAEPVTA